MRMLPRSAKGTWLLAGVVWVAMCALIWWLLPPWPRVITSLPNEHVIFRVGSAGRIITVRSGKDASGQRCVVGPVSIFNAANRSLQTILSVPELDWRSVFRDQWLVVSQDGRWAALPDDRGKTLKVHLIDIARGRAEVLTCAPDGLRMKFPYSVFSPDGRWLAVSCCNGEGSRCTRIWDVPERKLAAVIRLATWPMIFSPDSHLLVATVWDRNGAEFETDFLIWDTTTSKERGHLRTPPRHEAIAMTPDGTGFITKPYRTMNEAAAIGRPYSEYLCWDVADGRQRWSVGDIEMEKVTDGGRRMMMTSSDDAARIKYLHSVDVNNGNKRDLASFIWDDQLQGGHPPDGSTLLVHPLRPLGNDVWWWWLRDHRWPGPKPNSSFHLELVDGETGRLLFALPDGSVHFAPDGMTFLSTDWSNRMVIWDFPPSKPLTWFVALAAAVLALPFAGLAWRRVRRLRWEVA